MNIFGLCGVDEERSGGGGWGREEGKEKEGEKGEKEEGG